MPRIFKLRLNLLKQESTVLKSIIHFKNGLPNSALQLRHHAVRYRDCCLKKETLAQVFSCEFYEFYKNIFFNRTLPVIASKDRYNAFGHHGSVMCNQKFSYNMGKFNCLDNWIIRWITKVHCFMELIIMLQNRSK